MQQNETDARQRAVEARFDSIQRWIGPEERKLLTIVWTSSSETLFQYVLGSDPKLALAALSELEDREKAQKFRRPSLAPKPPFDPKRITEVFAQCLATTTDNRVRTSAALALAERNDPRSIPVLRTLLTPQEKKPLHEGAIPLRAAFLLARFQDTASYPKMRPLGSQLDDSTKRHFADLLGMMGDPSSVSLLRELLKNPDQGTRSHAALALGRVKDRPSVPALIHALTDGYSPVRRDAAWALAAIGDPKALPALKKAVTAQNSKQVPAHGFRGAQEMARKAVATLEKGQALEIARDWRGDPVGMSRL